MGFITKDTIKQILNFYPQEQHQLIKHQIEKMEEIINDNIDLYTDDKGYQKALDSILTKVIEGNFILKKD